MSTKLEDGLLKSPKIHQRLFPKIEKGGIQKVNAIIIHQTSAPTAQHTFNSYKNGGHGAHFLIAKDGSIFQTANLNKKAYHVGKIKSKCYETKVCTKAQLQIATDILFAKGQKYSAKITTLHNNEKSKSYPERYPLNSDSIGIEIVGKYNIKTLDYEQVTPAQNQSLKWLVGELFTLFSISRADVYRHPEVSYKMSSEARTASW